MNKLYKNVNFYSKSVLAQLHGITSQLNNEEYVKITKNVYGKQTNSSIGSHVRHIYDHFDKILNTKIYEKDHIVDYDFRARGTTLEMNRHEALEKHLELISKIDKLDTTIDPQFYVQFMIDGSIGNTIIIPSTLTRELLFVSHHGIHHISSIKSLILTYHPRMSAILDENFDIGKAPSTVFAEK